MRLLGFFKVRFHQPPCLNSIALLDPALMLVTGAAQAKYLTLGTFLFRLFL
jgi:hypothetical protein